MKFITKPIDIYKKPQTTLLMYLQLKCLPSDKPLEIDSGYWWVTYTDTGTPVAFAGLVRSSQWSNAGYMCRAGVLPAYRGNGLQKKLIQCRIRKARALKLDWLVTDTTDNPASANSLISMGFKMYIPSVPWGYKHSSYWCMKL